MKFAMSLSLLITAISLYVPNIVHAMHGIINPDEVYTVEELAAIEQRTRDVCRIWRLAAKAVVLKEQLIAKNLKTITMSSNYIQTMEEQISQLIKVIQAERLSTQEFKKRGDLIKAKLDRESQKLKASEKKIDELQRENYLLKEWGERAKRAANMQSATILRRLIVDEAEARTKIERLKEQQILLDCRAFNSFCAQKMPVGTDFRSVFPWVAEKLDTPKDFPPKAESCPVL